MLRDIKTLKQIASRTMYGSSQKMGTRKQQPASVSAQFQWSLNRLMAALNQANPFFIRCVKSNPEKVTIFNFQCHRICTFSKKFRFIIDSLKGLFFFILNVRCWLDSCLNDYPPIIIFTCYRTVILMW